MKRTKILKNHHKTSVQIYVIAWITFSTLLTLLPLYITLINSFKFDLAIKQSIFTFPTFAGGFAKIFESNYMLAWNNMISSFGRSILLAFAGSFFSCIIGTVLGYIFAYKKFYFKEILFLVFISVMMLPSIMGMPILIPFVTQTLNLKDTYFGYLLPIIAGSQVSSLFLFRTFFSNQPEAIYESAKIEGANDMDIYLNITIPLAIPIILYFFVGSVASIYNDYLWPTLIFDKKMTLMPMMKKLQETFTSNGNEGAIYAMYMISSIPLIVTSAISMKFFSSGNFASGLKL